MLNFPIASISLKTLPYTIRRFSLSTTPGRNKYQGREARFLNKFISSPKKKRKYYVCESPSYTGGGIKFGNELRPSKENSRRVAVLNKLFIQQISDLLATGSSCKSVLDKGLEISCVKLASDFKHLNVYWTSNNEKNLKALEALLPDLAFSLRHELSQLRVMGNVPRIVFVKDKQHAFAIEVDHLLAIADYGDDHVPIEPVSDFKTSQEYEVNTAKSQEQYRNDTNDNTSEELQSDLEPMPPMRNDVFNLDHDRIMKKIVKSMHKARALHRYEPNLTIAWEGIDQSDGNTLDSLSKLERKKAISKFILDRRLQLKRQNTTRKYDLDINNPLYHISGYDNGDNDENEEFYIEDYIEEDDFEEKRCS